jgi:hypothetical protein
VRIIVEALERCGSSSRHWNGADHRRGTGTVRIIVEALELYRKLRRGDLAPMR